MAYKRKFIILKKDYQNTHGNARGHCKLEMRGIRGIITLNMENGERENYYNVAILADDNKTSMWNLGKVFTDDSGKGKGEYSFTKRELESNDFPINKLSAIIILQGNKVLLGGYIDKDDGSIDRYISNLSSLEPDIQQEEAHQQYRAEDEDGEIEVEEEKREIEIEKYEEYKEEQLFESLEESQSLEGMESAEDVEDVEEIEIREEDNDDLEADEDDGEEDPENLDHIREINRKNQTTMYVLSILRFFPYIEPFEHNLEGFNWWIVEMERENEYKSFLPYFSHISGAKEEDIYSDDITCSQLMVKYKHYIFGLYNEDEKVKYYVYGIPGKFTKEEHPNAGADGFNTWHKGKDEFGYWLVYIDPMRGKPVYPEVPMVPIN